ncbi:unnamed protein product [Ilex paraguariensis]|uniref:Uncharacterized protein n=1 Tax=Ilex paraguariensis TaxID=185542 RepID=A0ABC8RB00_9AQUA
MAKLSFLLFFTLSLLVLSASARNVASKKLTSSTLGLDNGVFKPTRNYTHVCDASRFADLGLDMKDFAFCDSSLSYEIRVDYKRWLSSYPKRPTGHDVLLV